VHTTRRVRLARNNTDARSMRHDDSHHRDMPIDLSSGDCLVRHGATEPLRPLANMRVVVVDADDRQLKQLLRALRLLGVDPVGATTCAQAIEIINQGVMGAILDLRLKPDDPSGGLTAGEYLREHHPHVPAILFTGSADPIVQSECRRLRLLYLLKPPPSISSLIDYLRENQPAIERKESGIQERVVAAHRRSSPKLDILRDELYAKTIVEVGGNLTKAAERLGVSRQAIQQYIGRKREG
jgi:ActR/RegA family two-component response regulator